MIQDINRVPARGGICGGLIPTRYLMAGLGSIGVGIVYGFKVNLSVAMVGMLNHTAIALADYNEESDDTARRFTSAVYNEHNCQIENKSYDIEDGPFTWSEPMQGIILSCYFWGYFLSQIPGAMLAESLSAKWVMFSSVVINVICTLLTPTMASWSIIAILVLRFIEGLGGGLALPSMYYLLGRWSPPKERARLTTTVHLGTALGSAKGMLTATNIISSLGWEAVFYVMGGASLVWCCLWITLVQDSPQDQPYISAEERMMIIESLGANPQQHGHEKLPVPWKAIIKSTPFQALLIAHFCSNFGWYLLLTELPFYMKQILKYTIQDNALVTALPFFGLWIFSLLLSKLLDVLREKKKITTTTSRKSATLIGTAIPISCLAGLCYIDCDRNLAVSLVCIAVIGTGGMFCGILTNHIDLAPNHSAILMGLTNTIATIPGITVPLFVGHLTYHNKRMSAWRQIFIVSMFAYLVECVAFLMFGSGDEQPWNRVQTRSHHPKEVVVLIDLEKKPIRNEDCTKIATE